MKRNVTVSLDELTIAEAKALAARRRADTRVTPAAAIRANLAVDG